VQALENDIRAWVTAWNENPRPFTWTKTAEEIFDGNPQRISAVLVHDRRSIKRAFES